MLDVEVTTVVVVVHGMVSQLASNADIAKLYVAGVNLPDQLTVFDIVGDNGDDNCPVRVADVVV